MENNSVWSERPLMDMEFQVNPQEQLQSNREKEDVSHDAMGAVQKRSTFMRVA